MQDKEFLTPNASTAQNPPDRSVSADVFPPPSSTAHVVRTPTIKARLLGSADDKNSGLAPAHMRGYLSYVPALGRALDYHIMGYTVRQLIVLSAYLAVICVAMFYQSDPTTNVSRAGFVVMSQMPIVFALGTKNSVVTALTGVSYEQVCRSCVTMSSVADI
jgi:ferric-chelate reductase